MVKHLVVIFALLYGSSAIAGAGFLQEDYPILSSKEQEVLDYAYNGAYVPDGEQCALALTLGNPAIQDIDDRTTWTVPSTMVTAWVAQNAKRCECIGNKSQDMVDTLPEHARTKLNIKHFLYNIMTYMALRHRRYYEWEDMIYVSDTDQRFMVERVAHYCQ